MTSLENALFSASASAAPETRPAIVAVHQPERKRYRKRSCRHPVSMKRSCGETGESVAASKKSPCTVVRIE